MSSQIQTDIQFLEEMHGITKSLLYGPYDVTKLQHLDKMIEDWLNEMKDIAHEPAQLPSIIELEKERMAWALTTFPEATAISSLRKCETEIDEIQADIVAGIQNPVEYADAIMCLFDSAGRHGISIEQIIEAFAAKLEKNKSRKWTKNPDNSYSHVKEAPVSNEPYPYDNMR